MRRSLVAVVAGLVLVGAACDGDDSSQTSDTIITKGSGGLTIDGLPRYGEHDTAITSKAGDRFVIELESNASTGYQWTAASSDEAIVREESSEYLDPAGEAIGAPGTQRIVFTAGSAGTATLTLHYARGFEDGADARQIVYTVTVT